MGHEDKDNGHPHHEAVCLLSCAFQQTQVADQQGNLEETDAHLVNWTTSEIDPSVCREILLRPKS